MGSTAFEQLRRRLAEISDLRKTLALLSWDQQVMMPPGGSALRSEMLGTVGRIAHEQFIDAETGRLLDASRDWAEAQGYDSFEASLVRVTTRDWEKSRRVPAELRAEISRSASLAHPVWIEARENNDFASFLPVLRKNLDLVKRYIDCFDDFDDPYDVLLDDYERDMRSADVRQIFDYVKEHQGAVVKELGAPHEHVRGSFPLEKQQQFELDVVRRFGYDDRYWRLDPTVHPFASGTGIEDIRMTTRYFAHNLDGLFATMHEFGHGLYEHQVDPALERSPLARGVSFAFHESQSRMWENLVGRSLPFWRHFFPQLQKLFPEPFADYDVERWYAEINAVEPSLIRVESDEATYNFHIILRFELEQELIAGSFPLEQLPEEWNQRMSDYLGVEVPDDTHGVLQDTHWAGGSFGYFATYALGNLISAQLWDRVTTDLPDIYDAFEEGEFSQLRDWLREKIHRHGRKYTPVELLERITGSPEIDPAPYVRYLRGKLGSLYGASSAGL